MFFLNKPHKELKSLLIFQVLQMLLHFQYLVSHILIKIIISSLKILGLFRKKTQVVTKLLVTWCIYTSSIMQYLNATIFWNLCNFLEKKKLAYLLKYTLHDPFLERVNWLGLYISINCIINSRNFSINKIHIKVYFI